MAEYKLQIVKKNFRQGEVKLNDLSLYDHKILCMERPKVSVPSRQMNLYNVTGLNGFRVVDHGAYGERELTLKLAVKAKSALELETQRAFLNGFLGKELKLELYNYPYSYFTGFIHEISDIEESKELRFNYIATVKFKLQPYRQFNLASNLVVANKGIQINSDIGDKIDLVFHFIASGNVEITSERFNYRLQGLPQGARVELNVKKQSLIVNNSPGNIYKKTIGYPSYIKNRPINWTGNVSEMSIVAELGVI